MNLDQLVGRFRIEADDFIEPHLWHTDWVTAWLNEAQDEAALRGRLLIDDSTPGVCVIDVAAGNASYALHPKVYEIAHIHFERAGSQWNGCDLALVSREKLDRVDPHWRERVPCEPRWAIQSDTRIRLSPVPREAGTLRLEAYRLPLKALVHCSDKPEIHEAHHLHLVQWALYRAFSRPDSDAHDPQRAATAYENFQQYFGLRPDSDLRRTTRHDEVQANVPYI